MQNQMRYAIILIFVFTTEAVFSQNSDTLKLPKNSISLEIGGNAYAFSSVNYERLFPIAGKFYISGRAGVGGFTPIFDVSAITVPFLCNVIYNVYHVLSLEAGFGITLFFKTGRDSPEESGFDPLITGLIGLRLQHPKGFCFRVGFTPLFDTRKTDPYMFSSSFYAGAGLSFGYSF